MNEIEILSKLGWGEEIQDSLGILNYTKTDSNLTSTKTLSITRNLDSLDILFENNKLNINKKENIIEIHLPKDTNGVIIQLGIQGNWEVKTEEDLVSLVDHLQHIAMTMNVKSTFLLTELVKSKPAF